MPDNFQCDLDEILNKVAELIRKTDDYSTAANLRAAYYMLQDVGKRAQPAIVGRC